MKYIKFHIIFLFLNSFLFINTKNIGQKNQITVFTTNQKIRHQDTMAYGANFSAGFSIDTSDDIVQYEAKFPVSGPIDFNNGTIELNSDLILEDSCEIESLGNIVGNGHSFFLSSNIPKIPTNTTSVVEFSDLTLVLQGNTEFDDCEIIFTGDCTIQGFGNELKIGSNCQFTVGANSTLTLSNICVNGLQGSNIINEDDTATIVFDSTKLILTDNFDFPYGLFQVKGKCLIDGSGYIYSYSSSMQSLIQTKSSFVIGPNVTFLYDPINDLSDRLLFESSSSQLVLKNATLDGGTVPWSFQGGELCVRGNSFLTTDVADASGFIFGDGSSASNNMIIRIAESAVLEILQGTVQYDNV